MFDSDLNESAAEVLHRLDTVLDELTALPLKNTVTLARQLLRIGAGEASARVKTAAALGPRHGVSGEALGPIFAPTAQAQAAGTISDTAARVIIEVTVTCTSRYARTDRGRSHRRTGRTPAHRRSQARAGRRP